jgi:hypothetical protein
MKHNTPPADKPKFKDIDHDNLQALLDAAVPPRTTGGTTVRSRRSKERVSGVKFNDGRRLRSTGRDKQYNTNVTPDLFERVADMLDRFDLTKAEFTELALKAGIALLKSGGVEALQGAGGNSDDE